MRDPPACPSRCPPSAAGCTRSPNIWRAVGAGERSRGDPAFWPRPRALRAGGRAGARARGGGVLLVSFPSSLRPRVGMATGQPVPEPPPGLPFPAHAACHRWRWGPEPIPGCTAPAQSPVGRHVVGVKGKGERERQRESEKKKKKIGGLKIHLHPTAPPVSIRTPPPPNAAPDPQRADSPFILVFGGRRRGG